MFSESNTIPEKKNYETTVESITYLNEYFYTGMSISDIKSVV